METTLDTQDVGRLELELPPLTLTILVHPDLRRLGQQAGLEGPGPFRLSRKELDFADPGEPGAPLGDRHVSRRPVEIRPDARGVLLSSENRKATVDGRAIDLVGVGVDSDRLERGVVLRLGGRVALLLRRAEPAPRFIDLDMVGPSPELQHVRERVRHLAPGAHPILINGPTGTGKELVARAIHQQSERADRPWVPVNLAAIPPSTAAGQLFGHVRGAFTGAQASSAGLFGAAATGTLFLDELGEAPEDIQPLLLRALESGEIQVVGGKVRHVDVRVITATDADLEQAVESGRLRPALYHRLAGTTITLTPLRQRREDIAAQLRHFVTTKLVALEREDRLEGEWFGPELQAALVFFDWPGNTRQLARTVEAAVIEDLDRDQARLPELIARARAAPRPPPPAPPTPPSSSSTLEPMSESEGLADALQRHDYRLGPTAKSLGVAVNTLKAMMKRHGFRRAHELDLEAIEAARREVGDEVLALARALQVSAHGLRLRLNELDAKASPDA